MERVASVCRLRWLSRTVESMDMFARTVIECLNLFN
jgi:hypothetical protein